MNTQRFRDKNLLKPEGQLQKTTSLPKPVSLRCPHYLEQASFNAYSGTFFQKRLVTSHPNLDGQPVGMVAATRSCPNDNCRGIIFTITSDDGLELCLPFVKLDFNGEGLPEKLLMTLEEAISCHAIGAYRASAMMVRRLLEEICQEAGAEGKTLHLRLKELRSKISLPEELFEAMGALKALGNDAAHVEAKNYDQIGEGEAADSIELAKEILKARYQLKRLLDRLKSRQNS